MERLARIGIMRFEELLERWQRGRLSHDEAAAALGVSERTLRRWRHRYEEDGADGLIDRRVGQPSPRRAPEDELERIIKRNRFQSTMKPNVVVYSSNLTKAKIVINWPELSSTESGANSASDITKDRKISSERSDWS